jgi:holo-[acyl-carrier protein] synthase
MNSFELEGGSRVLGIGVDIVETTRIEASIGKFGDRFLQRVFTEGEREYCSAMPFPARHYAARFAAKEAVSKAFGTGIGRQLGWRDIEVKRKESGEPYILLHSAAAELAARLRVVASLISLSHSDHYAVANAVIIAKESAPS